MLCIIEHTVHAVYIIECFQKKRVIWGFRAFYLYFASPFVFNKRQYITTDRVQICLGTHMIPVKVKPSFKHLKLEYYVPYTLLSIKKIRIFFSKLRKEC